MNLTDRPDYLQYLANFHAYIIQEIGETNLYPQIWDGTQYKNTIMAQGVGKTYPTVIDEIFRAWNDIRDYWFYIGIDHFNRSGNLLFEIGSVHPRHYLGLNQEEQRRQLGATAVSEQIVRRYITVFQDNKVKGSGKMYSYLMKHTLEGQTHKTMVPYALLSGQLDLVTDDEEPFVKIVVTNLNQPKPHTREGVAWKKEVERFPTIEENLIQASTSKAFAKKTEGYTFKKCGPNLEVLYRDEGDQVNMYEKMRHDALKNFFEEGEKVRKEMDTKRH